MRRTVGEAEETEPLLAKNLFDTVRKADEQAIPEALEQTEKLADAGFAEEASKSSHRAGEGIEQLREGVERAARSVLGDETAALRRAQSEVEELANQINREIAQATGKDPSRPGRNDPDSANRRRGENGSPASRTGRTRPGDQEKSGSKPTGQGQQQGQGGQQGRLRASGTAARRAERSRARARQQGQGQQGQGGGRPPDRSAAPTRPRTTARLARIRRAVRGEILAEEAGGRASIGCSTAWGAIPTGREGRSPGRDSASGPTACETWRSCSKTPRCGPRRRGFVTAYAGPAKSSSGTRKCPTGPR